MNNQVEKMVSLLNQLYESLMLKKQVCGVNTRGGASTQDPNYPEGHPKRQEQEARKKNLLQENLPMKTKILMTLKNKIMILQLLMLRLKIIILKRKKHLHLKKNHMKLQTMKKLNLLIKKILNHLLKRIRRRTIRIHKKVKKGIHGYKQP